MSEDETRTIEIMALADNIRDLKHEVKARAKPEHLATLMWAVATDITIIHSVRWVREEVANSMIYKQYHYIAENGGELLTKCRDLHEEMDRLFPNVPERYTIRLFVMQYLVDPKMGAKVLLDKLFYLVSEAEALGEGDWET
jgi:hypothetical protein